MCKIEENSVGKTYSLEIQLEPCIEWSIVGIPSCFSANYVLSLVMPLLLNVNTFEIPTSFSCQLDCLYCYIKDKALKSKYISKKRLSFLLEQLESGFPQFHQVKGKISLRPWSAEPLCNLGNLELLIDFAENLKDRGKKVILGISTNGAFKLKGYLKRIFDKWSRVFSNKSLQISLDGPPRIQNRNRPFRNGEGSFDTVIRFAKDLYDEGFKINFLGTIFYTETIVEDLIDITNFYLTNPTIYEIEGQRNVPARLMFGGKLSKEELDQCILALKEHLKLLPKYSLKLGEPCYSFYFSPKKLTSISLYSRKPRHNWYWSCSALISMIGIDLDGNMYLCHNGIVNPALRHLTYIGNLFERTIYFKSFLKVCQIHFGLVSQMLTHCLRCPFFNGGLFSRCPQITCHHVHLEDSKHFVLWNEQKCYIYKNIYFDLADLYWEYVKRSWITWKT